MLLFTILSEYVCLFTLKVYCVKVADCILIRSCLFFKPKLKFFKFAVYDLINTHRESNPLTFLPDRGEVFFHKNLVNLLWEYLSDLRLFCFTGCWTNSHTPACKIFVPEVGFEPNCSLHVNYRHIRLFELTFELLL